MAIDTTVWASDLGAMISDLTAAVTFNAQNFTASITELAAEQTLLLVGNLTKYALSITFLQSSLSSASIALLKPQAVIAVQRPADASPVNYEIVSVHRDAADVAFMCVLKFKHTR